MRGRVQAMDYAKLVVVEYVPPSIMALVVGFIFASGSTVLVLKLLLGVLAALLIVFGYNTFNAIYDKSIDLINKPDRPLPKGVISDRKALHLAVCFFGGAILLSLLINVPFLLVVIITILLAIAYSYPPLYLKRHFLAGTVTGNVMYAVLFPMAGWAIAGTNTFPWQIIIFLFFFGMSIAILKDFEDLKGDAEHRIHTIPYVLGYSKATILSASFAIIAFFLLLGFILSGQLGLLYLLFGVIFVTAALVNLYLLSKDHSQKGPGKAFINGMAILTLMELGLVLIRLL